MEVIVPDDQLSLAIGKKGQNVTLASRLTGWRLDVRGEAEADEAGARLREGCRSMPEQKVLDIFDQVYVEQTPELAEQRDGFAAYLETFEGAH